MKNFFSVQKISIIIFSLSVVFISACSQTVNTPAELESSKTSPTSLNTEEIVPEPAEEFEPYTASFEIYTNGTKRIFTQAMYHNQSEDVFIESSDPSIIKVNKENVTWSDFFETLPFSLTKECLVTGTKQTFCSNETGQLRFMLNGIEIKDALDIVIQPDDELIVRYE